MKILNIYLFLLAVLIGVELAIGLLLAPVVFYPGKIIGDGVLTHFQSGQLMTQVFLKYNYMLLFVCVFSLVFEAINLKTSKSFYKKISSFLLSVITLILALFFVFVFTDYILKAQNLGEIATQSAEFAKVHKGSEIVMKLMLLAQMILFFIKFPRNLGSNA